MRRDPVADLIRPGHWRRQQQRTWLDSVFDPVDYQPVQLPESWDRRVGIFVGRAVRRHVPGAWNCSRRRADSTLQPFSNVLFLLLWVANDERVMSSTDKRVRELVASFGAPDACLAQLLCDSHDPDAVAFVLVHKDFSTELLSIRRPTTALRADCRWPD